MKTLFLFTLTLIMSLSLNARENPFAATNAYEEETARIIEQNELNDEQIDESQYIQEVQEKMNQMRMKSEKEEKKQAQLKRDRITQILEEKRKNKELEDMILEKKAKNKILETAYSKHQVEKLIKKAQKENEDKTKQLLQREIEKTKNLKPKEVVYVKPRLDVVEEDIMKTVSILPFLEISYNNEKFNITSKFNISKKFTLDNEKKIIVDFKSKEQFYTKRETLSSLNYKKIAIGNHRNEGFFRVVIQLEKQPSQYKVTYNNNQSITILSN